MRLTILLAPYGRIEAGRSVAMPCHFPAWPLVGQQVHVQHRTAAAGTDHRRLFLKNRPPGQYTEHDALTSGEALPRQIASHTAVRTDYRNTGKPRTESSLEHSRCPPFRQLQEFEKRGYIAKPNFGAQDVANSFLGVVKELVSPLDKEIWLRVAGERMRLAQSERKRRKNFKLRLPPRSINRTLTNFIKLRKHDPF
jgi:hypothetical protein